MPSSLPSLQELRVRGRRPSLPTGLRIYAVGDIHGRLDLLNRLLARTNSDIALRPTVRPVYVFLGDYIDRGPSSRETIDRLIEHGETHESVFLKGNHEQIALKCLSDRSLFDQWMRLGGLETLVSYGVHPEALDNGKQIAELQAAFHSALPQTHFRFFRDLQNSFVCGDFFFAHAGVKPGLRRCHNRPKKTCSGSGTNSSHQMLDFSKIVVHGHTPVHEVEVEPHRINIDTGAFATGLLTCLVIEGASASVIDTR